MFNWFNKEKKMDLNSVSDNVKNDIVKDAYYLINLFHRDNKIVTQLHVQKLMFLFEAFYMNMQNVKSLYECDYHAWNFGPVAIPLYKEFKKYGKEDVTLNEEMIKEGDSIELTRKNIMKEIYELFKDYTALQLVNFTHAEGSPWKEAWDYKPYSVIPKEKIKAWFSQYILYE